ncbi:hypothetical protein M5689_017996 [Euphorbia peplus]|nr:hypothetical protein M5689_017996 [Euphorbia peplus]
MSLKTLTFAAYFFFITIFIFQQPCTSQILHQCEHPSSCGNLVNISYPFRLKGDPLSCGDINYELSCENNQAILNLYSGKYYVKSINYIHSTIRIVDVGVQDGNCSSLPLYALTYASFKWGDPFQLSYSVDDTVMFLSCRDVIESERYIDASPCLHPGHRYVLVGEVMASDIGDWCTIDQLSPIVLTVYGNISIRDVHSSLVSGFELSWFHIACEDCKEQGFCEFERAISTVRCSEACNILSSFHCE